ncbi:hypothetical protein JI739_24110 [Ramlibacter sp. AW1]|uniref:Uncharacterized protein n=1 Tax=Ramlibacter aurantiacus TaxID=2801330 RepID=A0A937D464_9BURK|nr:hypothetical protein [Ramlibacter aurantiacus]MBL0423439.1 hypothetical protein [Ramlibacter aurantiacus]
MRLSKVALALQKEPSLAEYIGKLKVWHGFMVLAGSDGWDEDLTRDIRPLPEETEDEWLERCWDDLQPLEEHPIVVLKSREEMWNDWDGGFPELHLRIDFTHYSDREILDAMKEILKIRPKKESRGRSTRIRQRAGFQLNGDMDLKLMQDTLAIMRNEGKPLRVIASMVYPGLDGANQRVWDRQQAGRKMLEGIKKGRFPYPDRRHNGQI